MTAINVYKTNRATKQTVIIAAYRETWRNPHGRTCGKRRKVTQRPLPEAKR